LQNLIALDREYIDDLGTFSTLHHDYGLIPGAHRDLAQSLSNKELQLTSIIALLEAGRRLERNFDQAVVVNKSREAQAVADQALAQARVLEAEADAAQLRAAAAEVEAINAKAKADVDPGNAQKRAKADDLQRTARELRELARVKQASADEARTAALATQVTANEIKARLLSGSK
jgi:vacuolar-type H+-ATPase subunit I/STV1